MSKKKVDGKSYTVLTWSPKVQSISKKNYVINGYISDKNTVDRVETWLGENIMGDMHILAMYSGWKDFGGVIAPARSCKPAADIRSSRSMLLRQKPTQRTSRRWRFPRHPLAARKAELRRVAARRRVVLPFPRLLPRVTAEKLGDGLYRLDDRRPAATTPSSSSSKTTS